MRIHATRAAGNSCATQPQGLFQRSPAAPAAKAVPPTTSKTPPISAILASPYGSSYPYLAKIQKYRRETPTRTAATATSSHITIRLVIWIPLDRVTLASVDFVFGHSFPLYAS